MNELAIFEPQLRLLEPKFAEVLEGSGLAPARLMRTIMVCLERTPALLDCDRSSILQASMTAAVLGLEADGATGQFFMLPFARKAQPVIGYKGYATLAGRSGFTINGAIVRDGDFFEYELGSDGFVRHRPLLGGGRERRIIGGWATASRPGHAPIVQVMDIDELMFVKGRSPGARKSDSPWNDPAIGFPAMCEKTVKRRLARSMPLNLMVTAAAMEEAFDERQKHAFIHPEKGLVVDGLAQPVADVQPGPVMPSAATLQAPRFVIHKLNSDVVCATIEDWRAKMLMAIENFRTHAHLQRFLDLNEATMDGYRDRHAADVDAVGAAFTKRETEL